MTATTIVAAGLFGLIFGSFVTALTYRLPRDVSIARGRSACTACGHVLEWRDLFPVLSWVMSGGRCRHCGASVSWRYPAIEVSSAAFFIATVAMGGGLERTFILLTMIPLLLALAVLDLEHHTLPNVLIFPLAVLALIWRWRTGTFLLQGIGLAAAVAALAFLLDVGTRKIAQSAPPLMGGGDAKLLVVAAIALSAAHFFLFLAIAGFFGCVFGVVWQQTTKKHRFPFAPGLCLGLWAIALVAPHLPF